MVVIHSTHVGIGAQAGISQTVYFRCNLLNSNCALKEGSIDRKQRRLLQGVSYIYHKGKERKRETGLLLGRDGFGLRCETPQHVYSRTGRAEAGGESANTVEGGHTCRSDILEKQRRSPCSCRAWAPVAAWTVCPQWQEEGRGRGHGDSWAGGWGGVWHFGQGLWTIFGFSVKSKVRSLAQSEEGEVLETREEAM